MIACVAYRGRRAVLRNGVRAVASAALLLLLSGCIPIGVRVQNMFSAAFG